MKDLVFNNLTTEQLFNGAKLCVSNGEAHIKCAEEMAKLKQYGLANSHLILGMEECVKAILLFASSFNISIDEKVESYFRHHETKHKTGAKMDLPYRKILGIYNLIELFIPSKKGTNEKLIDIIEDFFDESSFDDWWKKANNRKNDGFYVGYENDWRYPQQITFEEYERSKKAIRSILKVIEFSKSIKIKDLNMLNNKV